MLKKLILASLIVLLLLPSALAQEDDKPSVHMLAYQPVSSNDIILQALLHTLDAYGVFPYNNPGGIQEFTAPISSAEEASIVLERVQGDGDISTIRGMIARTLDAEPAALITLSAPVTLAALNATSDMDDPPAIFFAEVYNPYEAGIGDAPCMKPNHVTGVSATMDYEKVVGLLLLQNPDMKTIGTLSTSGDAAGTYGAQQITAIGEGLGLTVEQAAVTSLADLPLAAEGLVSKGVEAILLPVDYTVLSGLPIINVIANDNGIPVFQSSVDGVIMGAAIGAGYFGFYDQGNAIGLMLAAYLNGELDIAATAINDISSDMLIGVNMAVMDEQGYQLGEGMEDNFDFYVEEGFDVSVASETAMMEFFRIVSGSAPLDDRAEQDQAYLDSLQCDDGM